MDINKIFKRVNIFKTILLVLILLTIISLVSFVFDILFIEKYKMNLSEIILLSIFVLSIILSIVDGLFIHSIYTKANKCLNELANNNFDLDAHEACKMYKASSFVSTVEHVNKNLYNFEFDGIKAHVFDVIFIKDSKSRALAHMYVYETSESFKEHYYMNHSLFVKGFENYKLDAKGNTNLYHFKHDDFVAREVRFSSNFYIAFKDNMIYFIDFNKKMFNIETDLKSNQMFKSYLKEKEFDIEQYYKKLITLK